MKTPCGPNAAIIAVAMYGRGNESLDDKKVMALFSAFDQHLAINVIVSFQRLRKHNSLRLHKTRAGHCIAKGCREVDVCT